MFDTNIACKPSKLFHGNYVVSMRPVKKELVDLAVKITEPMDYAHGAPSRLAILMPSVSRMCSTLIMVIRWISVLTRFQSFGPAVSHPRT